MPVKGLLQRINGPRDLDGLSDAQLVCLAREIRDLMVQTVARNGGHLAPNLGVVELTLALHQVLDSPRDRLVWDVGHQSYVHKLLTGRRDRFHTLRTLGGISGFPRPQESPHDPIGSGHTSTSLAAALGLALARDLRGEDHTVCAVIGDGSLTGGLAFEGLNNIGHLGTRMLVVLNDNEMSISRNVGSLSHYLSRLRSEPAYSRLKEDAEFVLRRIPAVGGTALRAVERFKDGLKYLLVDGLLFEELGFTYMGPVNGHDLCSLRQVLRQAQRIEGPVLVHVVTTKGKGYAPAEAEPDTFHGVGPFDVDTGRRSASAGPPSFTEVFGRTLVQLAEKDPRLVGVTAAMPGGTGLNYLSQRFPRRFFDVGIAEQHAVCMASGLAAEGYRPVVAIYSTFLQRAFDQVVHDVCLPGLPVVLALDRAGVVGEDGPTHHGLFDLAYLRELPGMSIMAPADEVELQGMLAAAVRHEGPSALRYPRAAGVGMELASEIQPVPWGRGVKLRGGADAAIFALGSMVPPALAAAERLQEEGLQVAVVNPRFVKPLDRDLLLHEAAACRRVLTVEEHVQAGGFGSAVLELLSGFEVPDLKVERLGFPDAFVEHGSRSQLLERYGLDAGGISRAVKQLLGSDPVREESCRDAHGDIG